MESGGKKRSFCPFPILTYGHHPYFWNSHYSGLNGSPQQDMSMFSPLKSLNVTLFGKRVFADEIKDLKMKLSWIIQVSPKFNSKCPYKRQKRRRGKWRQRLEQYSHNQGTVRAPQSGMEPGREFSYSLCSMVAPPAPWAETCGLHNYERINFCCYKPPN